MIAIDFPQFTDGRGYSHARLLRERYRYAGELRAIGDIERDQLYYLAQCGFDAFLIPDGRDARRCARRVSPISAMATRRRPRAHRGFVAGTRPRSPGDVAVPMRVTRR